MWLCWRVSLLLLLQAFPRQAWTRASTSSSAAAAAPLLAAEIQKVVQIIFVLLQNVEESVSFQAQSGSSALAAPVSILVKVCLRPR